MIVDLRIYTCLPNRVAEFVARIKALKAKQGVADYRMNSYMKRVKELKDPTAGADGKKGNVVFAAPSFLGGKNQMPMAYSPDTKLFYVPANEWGMEIWNEPITYKKGAAYLGAGFTIKTLSDGPIGALRAWLEIAAFEHAGTDPEYQKLCATVATLEEALREAESD